MRTLILRGVALAGCAIGWLAGDLPAQCESVYLVPADGDTYDEFGTDASLVGRELLVSAPGGSGMAANTGCVYAFECENGNWVLKSKLSPEVPPDLPFFGTDIARQGEFLAVGYPDDSSLATYNGACFIYKQTSAGWREHQKIYASDYGYAHFGISLDLSGDTLVVGAHGHNKSATELSAGQAYIFERQGDVFVEKQILRPSDWHGGWWFGHNLALEGDLLVVGATNAAGCIPATGAAYVFERQQGVWVETARLCASNNYIGRNFGWGVAISGRTIFVGDPLAYPPDGRGEVYVFQKIGGVWTEVQMLRPSGVPQAWVFGNSITTFGDRLLVGAPGSKISTQAHVGAAYLFERRGNLWEHVSTHLQETPVIANGYGFSVVMTGSVALVSAVGEDVHGESSGSLTLFPVGFGERYCSALPTSLGGGAEISVHGSASIAANDLRFAAEPLPLGQPGLLYCGPAQVEIPFGNGLRCVGGSLLRSKPAYPEGTLWRIGVDLSLPPYAGKLLAGTRWNFQVWFRDPMAGNASFNTTDALSILLVP